MKLAVPPPMAMVMEFVDYKNSHSAYDATRRRQISYQRVEVEL